METQMVLRNKEGKDIVCNIVAMWNKGNNKYIAYTDGTEDEEGTLELYVSKYDKQDETLKLIPIIEESEWNYVDEYLESNVFNDDKL